MTRAEHVAFILDAAHTVWEQRPVINPPAVAAISALESNFGQSGLYRQGLNPFGIKGTYQGDGIALPTWEVINGERIETTATFRRYPSIEAAIEDFATIISTKGWYRDAKDSALNPFDFLNGMKPKFNPDGTVLEPGWATDPEWFNKVWAILVEYRLRGAWEIIKRRAPGTDPSPTPSTGEPQRLPERFAVMVLNPPYQEGDVGVFAEAIRNDAPYIVRAPTVASITQTPAGAKLDIRRDGTGGAEVGVPREKAAIESSTIILAVFDAAVKIFVAVGLAVGWEWFTPELAATIGGASLLLTGGVISGRSKADSKITGLLSARKESP